MERTVRLMPFMFLLVGASGGVCWAMLFRNEEAERARVPLLASLPPAIIGSFIGTAVGQLVMSASARWPRIAPGVVVLSAGLLTSALAGPLGWIVGDMATDRAGEAGMLIGAAGGALIGLSLGAAQVVCDRNAMTADSDRKDYQESDTGSVKDEQE